MAAAVQPNSLGTLRKHFSKPAEQVAAPPGTCSLNRVMVPALDSESDFQLFGIQDPISDPVKSEIVTPIEVL